MAKTIPLGFESLFLCQQFKFSMAGVAEWFKVAPCEGGCRVRPTGGSNPLPGHKPTRIPFTWVWVVSVACCLTVLTTW